MNKNILICFFFIFTSNNFALDSFDLSQILEKTTVRINLWENYKSSNREFYAGGSGVVLNKIDDTYYILTNAHVVINNYCLLDDPLNADCKDSYYDETLTITVDTVDSSFEYEITYEDFIYWSDIDIAVIAIDGSLYEEMDSLQTIEIGGSWHPLQPIFTAGFPLVIGNMTEYRSLFQTSCVVNAFIQEEMLKQVANYSLVHDCKIAGGMSGGPLISNNGLLMGINGLVGEPDLEQDWKGNITNTDFDDLGYALAVHIYDLYGGVLSTQSGNFDPESKFFNFLPILVKRDHLGLYEYFQELGFSENDLDKIFN